MILRAEKDIDVAGSMISRTRSTMVCLDSCRHERGHRRRCMYYVCVCVRVSGMVNVVVIMIMIVVVVVIVPRAFDVQVRYRSTEGEPRSTRSLRYREAQCSVVLVSRDNSKPKECGGKSSEERGMVVYLVESWLCRDVQSCPAKVEKAVKRTSPKDDSPLPGTGNFGGLGGGFFSGSIVRCSL